MAQDALASLDPNCFKVLKTARDTLSRTENTVKYYDGRPSEDGNINIVSVLGPVFNVSPTDTFNSVSWGTYAVTLNYRSTTGQSNSNNVVLGANFFTESFARQGITLLHELLHVQFSSLDDPAFAAKYAHYKGDPMDVNAASQAISDWLRNGCK